MPTLNISATLNVLRTFKNPALICPHYTISTFDQLPVPLAAAFTTPDGKQPDIRAVVLDKDNCFATPHTLHVYPAYNVTYFSCPLRWLCAGSGGGTGQRADCGFGRRIEHV